MKHIYIGPANDATYRSNPTPEKAKWHIGEPRYAPVKPVDAATIEKWIKEWKAVRRRAGKAAP